MEAIVANLLGATALTLSLGGVANVPAPNGAHAAPVVTAQYGGYGSAALGATGFAQAPDGCRPRRTSRTRKPPSSRAVLDASAAARPFEPAPPTATSTAATT